MKSVGKTSKGLVRKNNQDNYLNQTTKSGLRIIAVADGLGGHKAGEVASSFAVEELSQYFSLWGEDNVFNHIEEIKNYILKRKNIVNLQKRPEESARTSKKGQGRSLCPFLGHLTDLPERKKACRLPKGGCHTAQKAEATAPGTQR